MFTEEEMVLLRKLLRDNAFLLSAQAAHDRAKIRFSILNKLELLGDCMVLLLCDGCGQLLELDAYAGHHVCRGCGKRLCDGCYDDNGPTCGSPKCQDWEKWERADYEYDRMKDR